MKQDTQMKADKSTKEIPQFLVTIFSSYLIQSEMSLPHTPDEVMAWHDVNGASQLPLYAAAMVE